MTLTLTLREQPVGRARPRCCAPTVSPAQARGDERCHLAGSERMRVGSSSPSPAPRRRPTGGDLSRSEVRRRGHDAGRHTVAGTSGARGAGMSGGERTSRGRRRLGRRGDERRHAVVRGSAGRRPAGSSRERAGCAGARSSCTRRGARGGAGVRVACSRGRGASATPPACACWQGERSSRSAVGPRAGAGMRRGRSSRWRRDAACDLRFPDCTAPRSCVCTARLRALGWPS